MRPGPDVRAHVFDEALWVEAELVRVAHEVVGRANASLMGRAAGRASPRSVPVFRRRLGGLRSGLRSRMYVGQRQMAPHVLHVARSRTAARATTGLRRAPQYGHSKSPYSTTVTGSLSRTTPRDRASGSTGSERSTIGLGCAKEPSDPQAPGQAARAARKTSQVRSDATNAADSTPSFASSSCTPPERLRRDQEREP